ncbi:SpoIIE family protein phosphatase [Sporobacter termitidis]|nr:SpoIIE family protein phosphatase [Sporobacter termitidis]
MNKLSELRATSPGRGTAALTRMDRPLLVECFVRFAMAFVLSGSQIFSGIAPFAVGFTAAAGSASGSAASLLGAVGGYLLSGSMFWAIKYICIAVIVCTAVVVFRDTGVFHTAWFMPAFAAFVTLCVDIVPAFDDGWALPAVALLLSDTVLAGASAYFYKTALSPWSGRFNLEQGSEIVHTVSVLILISTLLLSLAQLKILGVISVGRTLATLLVFLAAFKGGVGMGCATGISVGLAMDAASGAAPMFCTAYGLAGMISGIFSKRSKLVFALSYVLVDAVVAAVSIGNAGVPGILYEVFIASVIFMVLPPSFMSRLSVLLPGTGSGFGIIRAREYTKGRVDQTALAFKDLYETVKTAVGEGVNDGDVATVFDRAADVVCLSCTKTAKCWHHDYQQTVDAMNNATAAMMGRGSLLEDDLPEYFRRSCINVGEFTKAANQELKALLYRRQYKKRLRENQSAAFNQYADISAILKGISDELGGGSSFEPELESRLRKYLRSVNVQAETAVFRDRSGRLHGEIFGANFGALKKIPDYLDRLSAVFNVRLCTVDGPPESDRIFLLEAEPLAASVGICSKKKNEKEQSGDKGAYFKTDEGILYVVLSDGMGTGDQAARYSGDAVRILERFLRSGVAPETAVRLLNDLMLLKNEDDTGCATVDLVCINLFTGSARMFKYGAAPSYLRHGSTVRRMKGKSLAAGLGVPPHDAPDQLKMELKAGSAAVIVSDGVTAGLEDDWLCEHIAKYEGKEPRELAASIIEAASPKVGAEDDMTVIAIFVTERE